MKMEVSGWKFDWSQTPTARQGQASVRITAPTGEIREERLKYELKDSVLWLEFSHATLGYAIRASRDESDPSLFLYEILGRNRPEHYREVRVLREGDSVLSAGAASGKKALKIKSQMPGKILKCFVQEGAVVEKGQPLMVMEAMKMENEIKAPQSGKVAHLKVSVGQTVESGAELCQISAGGE